MTDLYDILGVAKDADAQTIKRAYRAKSKKAHPDKGGKKEDFQALQHAYEVLSDPELRAHYDETGDDGTQKRDRLESLLFDLFENVIRASGSQGDIIAVMLEELRESFPIYDQKVASLRKQIAEAEKLKARIKRVSKKRNFIVLALDQKITAYRAQIEKVEQERAMTTQAIAVVEDFKDTGAEKDGEFGGIVTIALGFGGIPKFYHGGFGG